MKRYNDPSSETRRSTTKRLDFPFLVIGLSFVLMAVLEFIFPDARMGGRGTIKVLCIAQISFAMVIALFGRTSMIVGRWVPTAFLLLFMWLCLSGLIHMDQWSDTMYLWGMHLYWYALFVFFLIRSNMQPERIHIFLLLAVCSLLVWLPALKYSTLFLMKFRYDVQVDHLLQNYVGYYIVAMFPFALMLKRKILKAVAIAVIAYGAFYSLKRGAVLALFLMGMSSSFLYLAVARGIRKKGRIAVSLFVLWSIAIAVGGWFVWKNQDTVERRLATTTNRPAIYERAMAEIKAADLYQLIIGHGDRQMYKAIRAHTHNDWLFILYDYGVIGVLLMINVYMSILFFIWKLWRVRSTLLLPLVSALILMLCVQLYSIGLLLKTFGYISGSIGLVAGLYYADPYNRLKTV